MRLTRKIPGEIRARTAPLCAGTLLAFAGTTLLFSSACGHHPMTDYRPLLKVGMSSASIEQLKKLDTSDAETAQLISAKQAGISDETCVALVTTSHQNRRAFTSAEAVNSLAGAGFGEPQILEIARVDKLDTVSGDAVTLRLIGLSDSTVQNLLQRHLLDQPTLSSGEIARLKNTGLTEAQVLERINQGMTDEQAEKEVLARTSARNHYGTGFTRIHGRKPR
jgi:hypothetical protein